MARTIFSVNYSKDFATAKHNIETILAQCGFKETVQNNESVWKKGKGFWTAPQFLRVDYSEKGVTISAWILAGGSEMDLEGVVGAIPKRSLMNVVEKIKLYI